MSDQRKSSKACRPITMLLADDTSKPGSLTVPLSGVCNGLGDIARCGGRVEIGPRCFKAPAYVSPAAGTSNPTPSAMRLSTRCLPVTAQSRGEWRGFRGERLHRCSARLNRSFREGVVRREPLQVRLGKHANRLQIPTLSVASTNTEQEHRLRALDGSQPKWFSCKTRSGLTEKRSALCSASRSLLFPSGKRLQDCVGHRRGAFGMITPAVESLICKDRVICASSFC